MEKVVSARTSRSEESTEMMARMSALSLRDSSTGLHEEQTGSVEQGRGSLHEEEKKPTRSMSFSHRFDKIYDSFDLLENSMKTSNENLDKLLLTKTELEQANHKIAKELEREKRKSKNLIDLFRLKREGCCPCCQSSPSLRDQPSQDRHYARILHDYHKMRRILKSRGEEVKRRREQVEELRQDMEKLNLIALRREEMVADLCTRFLALKRRKDVQREGFKQTVECLEENLTLAMQKLKERVDEQDRSLRQLLSATKDRKHSLSLEALRRSNELRHQNLLLTTQLRQMQVDLWLDRQLQENP